MKTLSTEWKYQIQSRIEDLDPPDFWLSFGHDSYDSPGDAYNDIFSRGDDYARLLEGNISFRILAIKTEITEINRYCYEEKIHGKSKEVVK